VIVDPSGTVVARTTPGHSQEVIAEIDLADAANKQIAARTDIFDERRPALYRY
jgi:predicted amidohydrolase